MRCILAAGLFVIITGLSSPGGERPLVGAIRWDAWTGGPVTKEVERTLGPQKHQDRLPWFADVIDEATVRIDGSRPDVMERELAFAASAGLDYWAFLIYPRDNAMSVALGQYLASPNRAQIRFCLILHNSLNVPAASWPEERARAVALLKEPGYQMVLGGRPLVYAFSGGEFPFQRFEEFLAAAKSQGLHPYCVFMGWNPAADFARVRPRGFDAVSAYAMPGSQSNFTELATSVEKHSWQAAARAQVEYVPLVTTGWDKRPRKDHPVSWERGQAYHQQEIFPSRATPAEISGHLANALAFVRDQPGTCRANAVILYAWNEYDEGGWIAPTRGADGKADTSRLDAIRPVLRPAGP